MKRLYARVEDDLESIRQSLMHAEAGIFDSKERRMVEVLSNISRELTDLKQSSRVHKEVIEAFGPAAQAFFGQDFKYHYIDDIIRQYGKIHELTSNNHELLNDLRETNDSLLSTKQNEIMQTLTIIASIIFPLELVNYLLLFQSLLVFGHFLWFDDMIDELNKWRYTLRIIWLITG